MFSSFEEWEMILVKIYKNSRWSRQGRCRKYDCPRSGARHETQNRVELKINFDTKGLWGSVGQYTDPYLLRDLSDIGLLQESAVKAKDQHDLKAEQTCGQMVEFCFYFCSDGQSSMFLFYNNKYTLLWLKQDFAHLNPAAPMSIVCLDTMINYHWTSVMKLFSLYGCICWTCINDSLMKSI